MPFVENRELEKKTMRQSIKVPLHLIVIEKNEVKKLLPQKKRQYLMITSMLRDLNLFQKTLLFIHNDNKRNDVFVPANEVSGFLFIKILISKIHEMIAFLNADRITEGKNNFSQELKKIYEDIEEYIAEKRLNKIFGFIRNKLGFHYEAQKNIEPIINKIMKAEQKIEMWLSEDSANEIFSSSNEIMQKVIYAIMRKEGYKGQGRELMNELFEMTVKMADSLYKFYSRYLIEVVLVGINIKYEKKIEVNALSLSQIKLSFLTGKQ